MDAFKICADAGTVTQVRPMYLHLLLMALLGVSRLYVQKKGFLLSIDKLKPKVEYIHQLFSPEHSSGKQCQHFKHMPVTICVQMSIRGICGLSLSD